AGEELEPPELAAHDERGDQVIYAAEQDVEREDRGECLDRAARPGEGDDPDDGEQHREREMGKAPPALRREGVDDLEPGAAEANAAEQDRERLHRRVVEAEQDQREEDPERAGEERDPPEVPRGELDVLEGLVRHPCASSAERAPTATRSNGLMK